MEPQEPNPNNPSAAEEALRRLEERLSRASEAAERLIAEAAGSVGAAATGGEQPLTDGERVTDGEPVSDGETVGDGEPARDEPGMPPPAGWQTPPSAEDTPGRGDLELLMQFIQSVRELIPPDLQRRLAEALRELLLAIRALIDWYLERSEQRRSTSGQVQDIPIL